MDSCSKENVILSNKTINLHCTDKETSLTQTNDSLSYQSTQGEVVLMNFLFLCDLRELNLHSGNNHFSLDTNRGICTCKHACCAVYTRQKEISKMSIGTLNSLHAQLPPTAMA